MDFGRFHGRNIILINIGLSLNYRAFLAGTVTDAAAETVYGPAISVTQSDYFWRSANLSPHLTPDPRKLCGLGETFAGPLPHFAPPQRRIDAGREQTPGGAVARLGQRSRDIR